MPTLVELMAAYRKAAINLANSARRDGIIITMETVPLEPKAMGHYAVVVDARAARGTPYHLVDAHAGSQDGPASDLKLR